VEEAVSLLRAVRPAGVKVRAAMQELTDGKRKVGAETIEQARRTEVKDLAKETARASDEIAAKVAANQADTQNAVQAILTEAAETSESSQRLTQTAGRLQELVGRFQYNEQGSAKDPHAGSARPVLSPVLATV
jgi:methyl-accepting chemotaxis protein